MTVLPLPGFDPPAAQPRRKSHVAHNGRGAAGTSEWYTPAEYIEAVREVLGGIDLDPASCPEANTVVAANRFYTASDNALWQPWHGRVFMNPPYASGMVERFARRLIEHWQAGMVPEAIVLVNNASEVGWWQALAVNCTALCLPRGRVRFWRPGGARGGALQGQTIFYLGLEPERFVRVFAPFGLCCVPLAREGGLL